MLIFLIILYIIGVVVSYLCFRTTIKRKFLLWTKSDRNIFVFVSLFSWIGIIVLLIDGDLNYIFNRDYNPDDEAKW
jgi:formate hydrogenlyase subunit 3/multisubunit Na+/H+ antiporter MnhD subunit